MALKAVKGTFERMLDKNLQDLVRGIRNHKDDEARYIAECLEEIKAELKVDNIAAKANAINKLIYLQMLGNDIGWAAFNVIEVMSSTKFTYKRIGYLAAAQSFHDQTDVLMLTTNLIRKDLNSPNYYETGVALSGLSCFLTSDLARDLAGDIMTLMNSTKPYIRKKAVLLMYKVFLKFPDALRPAFPRLKEKLEDPDPGVQSAAVNVICELARKNPKNYLSLAPLFFKLMNSSNNNWVLIKIIKLFGALTPLEPRLGKKLIEPLTNLIHSTSAMSLLYECINTVIAGIPNHSASIQLCVQKLRILIEDSDQNLKYLGLLAMTKILKSHPKSVQTHKDLILNCLDDKDESIRLRALDLLYGMISKKNIMEIVKKLMSHMDKTEGSHYRNELLVKIIQITTQDNYQYITNFEWYVTVLVELTRVEGIKNGELIASQLLDVAIRVPTVRDFTVKQMASLLQSTGELMTNSKLSALTDVIYAAAWICGEYAEHLINSQKTLNLMLQPAISALPGHIQSVLVQNTLKLYCHLMASKANDNSQLDSDINNTENDEDIQAECIELTQCILDRMASLVHSSDLEVQERAVSTHQLLRYILKQLQKPQVNVYEICRELGSLFGGEINPVTARAQRKVQIPPGLDLDTWINEPPRNPSVESSESSQESSSDAEIKNNDDDDEMSNLKKSGKKKKSQKKSKKRLKKHRNNVVGKGLFVDTDGSDSRSSSRPTQELTEEELEAMRQLRLKEQDSNPHYLKDSSGIGGTDSASLSNGYINLEDGTSLPNIEPLEKVIGQDKVDKLNAEGAGIFPSSDYYLKLEKAADKKLNSKKFRSKKKKKGSKPSGDKEVVKDNDDVKEDTEENLVKHVVKSNFDLPEGAELDKDDGDEPNIDVNDPHRLLNIDLEQVISLNKNTTTKDTKEPIEKTKKKSKKGHEKSNKKSVEDSTVTKLKKKSKKKADPSVEVELKLPETKEQYEEKDDFFSEWLKDTDNKESVDKTEANENEVIVKKETKKKRKSSTNIFDNFNAVEMKSDDFSQLLSSGKLSEKYSSQIRESDGMKVKKFQRLLKFVCKQSKLAIVEVIDNTASLYSHCSLVEEGGHKGKSQKMNKHHLCVLLKMNDAGTTLKLDAKSDNLHLIKSTLRKLKKIILHQFPIKPIQSADDLM